MHLGISTYTYTWAIGIPGSIPDKPLDHPGLLAKTLELGVDLIQVADNLALDKLSPGELKDFHISATDHGVQLEAGARGMTDENLEHYIEIAGKIDSHILRFVIDGKDFKPGLEEINGIIRNALPVLKARKIVLALENYERLRVRDFARIVEKAGSSQVGICLDCVNSMGAGEGIETVVDVLAPMTVNLHIKEFAIKRIYHMMGFHIEGRPAGEGMLDIAWLLDRMPAQCQSVILEQWVPPDEGLASTLDKEHRWALESIENLKPFFE